MYSPAACDSLKRQVDPVLDFLRRARLDDRHAEVLAEESAVGGDLRRFAPRIIAA